MRFFTSTLERIKINDAGNVFISTPITNAFYGLSLTYNNANTADFTVNQATGQIKIGGVATGYFPTFYAGGSEKMRIDTSGYISTPADKRISVGGWDNLGFTSGAAFGFSVQSTTPGLFLKETDQTNRRGFLAMSGGGMYIGGSVDFLAIDVANGNRALTINDSLNVGIGTTSPTNGKFVINQNSSAASFGGNVCQLFENFNTTDGQMMSIGFRNNNSVGTTAYIDAVAYDQSIGATDIRFSTYSGSAWNSNMVTFQHTGRVGIGTTSPVKKLDVARTATTFSGASTDEGAVIRLTNPSNWENGYDGNGFLGGIEFYSGDASESGPAVFGAIKQRMLTYYNDTAMCFFTSEYNGSLTERMRITSGGEIQATRGNAGTLYVADSTSSAGTGIINFYSAMAQQSNNTNCSHFKGTTQNIASYHLYGNGSSSWSSDSRLKRDIKTTRDGYIDDINKLRVVKYKWKNDENSGLELGLIAQEVEKIFPSLVVDHEDAVGNGETYKSLKYSVLPTILLKGMQEQQKMIQELKAEIETLKTQING
jgi:hypothetical protein